MRKGTRRTTAGVLLTLDQASELANLGTQTTRRLAGEANAIRRFGRCIRIDRQQFFDYITRNY